MYFTAKSLNNFFNFFICPARVANAAWLAQQMQPGSRIEGSQPSPAAYFVLFTAIAQGLSINIYFLKKNMAALDTQPGKVYFHRKKLIKKIFYFIIKNIFKDIYTLFLKSS